MYRASAVLIVLIVKSMEECTFSPPGMMFFYLMTRGWNFTSAYVRIRSINIRRQNKNAQRVENDEIVVHKIRLHGRRGKGMAESFSREKLRHAPQKEGG